MKKREDRIGRILSAVQTYILFLVTVSFPVTCCMMLFISYMQKSMGFVLGRQDIQFAAVITFANVLLLTALFAAADKIRRLYTVDRPIRQILNAAERIMQGDFSVRIPQQGPAERQPKLSEVAECINRMAQELSGIETLRVDFISNVSHEMKTPLAAISNYAALLQMPNLTPKQRQEYTCAIEQTAKRLAGLVYDILRLNKLENQQIYPESTEIDLGVQIAECLISFEEQLDSAGLELDVELQENVVVCCDAQLLNIVWHNLLSNAIKFTDAPGSIGVRLYTQDGYAVVQVSDTGCGISSEVGARIFDKFYQADSSRATRGNGLGLALVKRVIDIVGGDITVSSRVGEGSVFSVRLKCS